MVCDAVLQLKVVISHLLILKIVANKFCLKFLEVALTKLDSVAHICGCDIVPVCMHESMIVNHTFTVNFSEFDTNVNLWFNTHYPSEGITTEGPACQYAEPTGSSKETTIS